MAAKVSRTPRSALPERYETLHWLFGAWSDEINNVSISKEAFNRKNPLANMLAEMFQNVADAGSRIIRLRWAYVSLAALETGKWSEIRERASGTSLSAAAADDCDDVLCLFVEDRGCGLNGPYCATRPGQRPGGFQSYVRGIGNSSKGAGNSGSKGIGRDSAALASELRTVFVFSKRREDGEEVFFGRAILDQHNYRDTPYQYDGLLLAGDGTQPGSRPPLVGRAAIEAATAIGISRDWDEFGTTVMIPAVKQQIRFDKVLREILLHRFVPIISGALTVELVGINADGEDDVPLVIDADTIGNLAAYEEANLGEQHALVLATATRALAASTDIRFDAGFPNAVLRDKFFPEDELATLASHFNETKTFAAKTSFVVRRRTTGEQGMGSLTFAVAMDERLNHGAAIFIRDGISIVRRLPGKPYVIVTIAGRPFDSALPGEAVDQVAAMLRDGENTSHDDWNASTMEERGWTYEHATLVTTSFKESAVAMVNALSRQITVNDAAAFADIFSFESSESTSGRSESDGQQTRTKQKPGPTPDRAANDDEVFALSNIEPDEAGIWGFGIERVPETRKRRGRPTEITAVFGFSYASTEAGKSSRKHTLADFDLRSPEFEVVAENCGSIQRDAKTILVSAPRPDFRMTVRGPFDSFRELEVRLEAMTRNAPPPRSKNAA